MESAKAHPLPPRTPSRAGRSSSPNRGLESGITIRGRFEVPRFAKLSPDQARFLETFLRCRGMLNSVEKELGISYPTARARLDAVLRVLDLRQRSRRRFPKPRRSARPAARRRRPDARPGPRRPAQDRASGEIGSVPRRPSQERSSTRRRRRAATVAQGDPRRHRARRDHRRRGEEGARKAK